MFWRRRINAKHFVKKSNCHSQIPLKHNFPDLEMLGQKHKITLFFQLCFCGQPAADTRVLLGHPNFDPQPNPPLSHFSLRKQGIQYFTHICMKFLNSYWLFWNVIAAENICTLQKFRFEPFVWFVRECLMTIIDMDMFPSKEKEQKKCKTKNVWINRTHSGFVWCAQINTMPTLSQGRRNYYMCVHNVCCVRPRYLQSSRLVKPPYNLNCALHFGHYSRLIQNNPFNTLEHHLHAQNM